MSDQVCAKCGEKLEASALSCWACGTLTPLGRRAKRLPEDEDETWRKSVEAAKARHGQRPAVDPDEVLRKVLAESGTEEQIQRVTRVGIAHDDARTDHTRLRASSRTVATVGILLAVLFAMAGLLLVAFALVVLPGNSGALLSLVGVVVFGAAAIAVYFVFRTLAGMIEAVADAADNARRSVLLLRETIAASKPQEGE